jgi:hypothetical protein
MVVGSAIILALIVAWASAYTASRIDVRTLQRALPSWRPVAHGDASPWIDGLLLAWCIGPPLLFGSVALWGSRRNWSVVRWVVSLALLSALTAVFYCAWYIFRA